MRRCCSCGTRYDDLGGDDCTQVEGDDACDGIIETVEPHTLCVWCGHRADKHVGEDLACPK